MRLKHFLGTKIMKVPKDRCIKKDTTANVKASTGQI